MNDIPKKHKEAKKKFFTRLSFLLSTNQFKYNLLGQIEEECKFPKNYHHILFPGKEKQIIEEFESWQDHKMIELLSLTDHNFQIRKKIAYALETRLISVVPKAVIMQQNVLFLMPGNILSGIKCFYETCNLIWRYAGDNSNTFNYYSKRWSLLCLYKSFRLFYLSDNSKEFAKTKEFIATSLEMFINILKTKKKVGSHFFN